MINFPVLSSVSWRVENSPRDLVPTHKREHTRDESLNQISIRLNTQAAAFAHARTDT